MQGSPSASSVASKVTILLHTRNRAESLLRTLDHFQNELGGSNLKTYVLDASDEAIWAAFHAEFGKHEYSFPVVLWHAPANSSLRDRLIDAVAEVETPYVMLAADDDFYAFDWLEEAVTVLDANPSIGTVHGHVLFFDLEHYQAYAQLDRLYVHPRRDPPVVWLEDEDPVDRLRTLTTGVEPSVVGWYALQRTEQLRAILDAWQRHDVPLPLAEYLLVLGQATRKTRMLDRIILARQGNPHANHAHFDVDAHPEGVAALTDASRDLWAQIHPITPEIDAEICRFLDGPIRRCRMMNSPQYRRRQKWRQRFPFLVDLYRTLLGRGDTQITRGFTAYPDPRLPPIPNIDESHVLVRKIREATAPR